MMSHRAMHHFVNLNQGVTDQWNSHLIYTKQCIERHSFENAFILILFLGLLFGCGLEDQRRRLLGPINVILCLLCKTHMKTQNFFVISIIWLVPPHCKYTLYRTQSSISAMMELVVGIGASSKRFLYQRANFSTVSTLLFIKSTHTDQWNSHFIYTKQCIERHSFGIAFIFNLFLGLLFGCGLEDQRRRLLGPINVILCLLCKTHMKTGYLGSPVSTYILYRTKSSSSAMKELVVGIGASSRRFLYQRSNFSIVSTLLFIKSIHAQYNPNRK